MNLYIESIEGGNYIAGIGEHSAQTMLRDNYRDSASFQSLSAIKEHLGERKFSKVWLKQNTPYDEMCGSHDENEKLLMEIEWR